MPRAKASGTSRSPVMGAVVSAVAKSVTETVASTEAVAWAETVAWAEAVAAAEDQLVGRPARPQVGGGETMSEKKIQFDVVQTMGGSWALTVGDEDGGTRLAGSGCALLRGIRSGQGPEPPDRGRLGPGRSRGRLGSPWSEHGLGSGQLG